MTYSVEQREKILVEVCTGLVEGLSMRKICERPHLPNIMTILDWMNNDKEFLDSIARARELQADAIFDDMTELTNQMIEDGLDPQAVRTAIWAKQWQASKLRPKKYGNNINIEGSVQSVVVQTTAKELAEARRIAKDEDDC